MVMVGYSNVSVPDACAGCITLQRSLSRSSTILPSRSPPLHKSLYFSSSSCLSQSSLRSCNFSPLSLPSRPKYEPRKRVTRLERQALSSEHVVALNGFGNCGNGRIFTASSLGSRRKLSTVCASTQEADQEPRDQSGPDASSNQIPSGKEENRNGKPSSHCADDENRPSTSGRAASSSGPPEQGWWWKPKWSWNGSSSWKRGPAIQVHEIGALLLQLSVVVLLMRLLRPGDPFPGRSSSSKSESNPSAAYVSVPFSEFLSRIDRNDVESVEIDGHHFSFTLRHKTQPVQVLRELQKVGERIERETDQTSGGEGIYEVQSSAPTRKTFYTTTRPSDIHTPYTTMQKNGVEFGAPDKRSAKLFNTLSMSFLYICILASVLNRFSSNLPQRSTGRLRSRKGFLSGGGKDHDVGGPIMFADVAGVDEAKEELEEIVEFLKNPERYARLGARPPRGVLLVGPPGTGKTLLAKAVAGEADVPFISCSASEFVELYVGMGASRVRDLFARAKKEAPSIVFIDEIDAVAKGRDGRHRSVGNDEREQTLNQLLTELDGFESNSTVIVLGATNRADVLDPALRRPGRFDRIVMVEPPDRQGREEILAVHVTKKQLPLAPDVNLNVIAAATAGFTGADLANLVNEAALLAGRESKLVVGNEEFSLAVERSIAGIEKKRSTLHGSEKAVVARHEAGHAVVGTAVAKFITGLPRVQKLSILPRTGGTLGFTYIPPAAEDRNLLFIDELRGRLVTLLGGRAAEEVVFSGRVSTGALDDIKRATDLAYKAIAEYGLSSTIGPISLATLSGGGLDETGGSFSWGKDQGHMTDMVQKEVRTLMQSAMEMALLVIRSNPSALEGLGAQLESEERISGAPLEEWLNMVVAPVELAAYIREKV